MPKDEIEDEEHIDKDGRKYYTAKQNDPDMSDKSRFWVGSEGAILPMPLRSQRKADWKRTGFGTL